MAAEFTEEEIRVDTAKHYDDCYWDYRTAWFDNENLALHYGYWEEGINTHSQALLNKNRILYQIAGIKPEDHVLDAGCGIGGSSIWLAKNVGCRATGITVSAEQVEHAKRNAKRHGVAGRVDFQAGGFLQDAVSGRDLRRGLGNRKQLLRHGQAGFLPRSLSVC